MGVALNTAEIRNAEGGPLGRLIDVMATTHTFFVKGRIPEGRFKRQDYLAHAFAMAAYRGRQDIKAQDLILLIKNHRTSPAESLLKLSAEVGKALNVLARVNEFLDFSITQKWIFLDLCWLIMQHQEAGSTVDPKKLAVAYDAFEQRRLEFNRKPDNLISGVRRVPALDRHLYNYIIAFRVQGGLRDNLRIRNKALHAFCQDITR